MIVFFQFAFLFNDFSLSGAFRFRVGEMLKSWPVAAAGGCNFGLNQFFKRSHFRIADKISSACLHTTVQNGQEKN